MRRKTFLGLVGVFGAGVILVALLAASTTAEPARGKRGLAGPQAGPHGLCVRDGSGPGCGQCFVDADGDGVCDRRQDGSCPGRGEGRGHGKGMGAGRGCRGAGFADADGDGVCDNRPAGAGRGCGRGRGHGRGQGQGQGRGFVDADGDGVCDRR